MPHPKVASPSPLHSAPPTPAHTLAPCTRHTHPCKSNPDARPRMPNRRTSASLKKALYTPPRRALTHALRRYPMVHNLSRSPVQRDLRCTDEKHPLWTPHCPPRSEGRPERGAQSVAPRAWRPEHGAQSMAPRAWRPEHGAQSVAPRAWCPERGAQSVAPRAWCPEHGAQNMAPPARILRGGSSPRLR